MFMAYKSRLRKESLPGTYTRQALLKKDSGDRNRTCDTGLMSPLLYRLSYATV